MDERIEYDSSIAQCKAFAFVINNTDMAGGLYWEYCFENKNPVIMENMSICMLSYKQHRFVDVDGGSHWFLGYVYESLYYTTRIVWSSGSNRCTRRPRKATRYNRAVMAASSTSVSRVLTLLLTLRIFLLKPCPSVRIIPRKICRLETLKLKPLENYLAKNVKMTNV